MPFNLTFQRLFAKQRFDEKSLIIKDLILTAQRSKFKKSPYFADYRLIAGKKKGVTAHTQNVKNSNGQQG